MPTRVLLVIDVQREYVDGNLPIAYPPLSVSLPNIASAVDAADAAGVPVVLVRHVDDAGSPVFAAGSRGAELHDVVASAPHALLIEKQRVSCFAGTGLGEWLQRTEVDTVTIAGFMTQHCDESTARDAADLGLAVEVLSDATGTLPLTSPSGSLSARAVHERTLAVLGSGFVSVATTADWIGAVEAGTSLPEPDLWAATASARSAF